MTFEGNLQAVPEIAASDGDDLLRADGRDPNDQVFDPNAAVGGVWDVFGESGGGD